MTTRILIVDDIERNLMVLEAVLESPSVSLVRARSGREALRALLDDDYSLILLDVQMPEMDGFETAVAIRGREKTRHVPIIFVTAHNWSEAQVLRAYEVGASDFLIKPIRPEILRAKVGAFVEVAGKVEAARTEADVLHRQLRLDQEEAARVEQRRLQGAVRESERRFRTLAEATSDIVWTADAAGHLRDSPSWRDFTGLDPDAHSNGGAWQAVHPDDRQTLHAGWAQAVERRSTFFAECRLRRRDGVYVPMAAQGIPVSSDNGGVREWVGTLRDISAARRVEKERAELLASETAARREAETARRRMSLLDQLTRTLMVDLAAGVAGVQRMAESLVPQLADWATVYMPAGMGAPGAIEAVAMAHFDPEKAGAAFEMLRRNPLDPDLGHGIPEVFRNGEPELLAHITDEMLVAAAHSSGHLAHLRQQGIVSHLAVPMKAHGRVIGCLSLTQTTSGRHFTEDDLPLVQELALRAALLLEQSRLYHEAQAARAEAEAATRAKDQFLALLGHELRNPLAPIRTALQLMRLRGTDAAMQERAIIERQVEHLVELVDDLLDVSRITRGKIDLKRQPIEIDAVVADAIEMASPLLEQRGHNLEVSIPKVGLRVNGDPSRLAQVFANLLTNAAKYTDPGGTIIVAAQAHEAEPGRPRAVVVRVEDHGSGITPELLPHVFELFSQSAQTLERSQGGLGIGLSIVRSLVGLHEGAVTAHSEGPGKGSELVVTLPLLDGDVTAPATPERATISTADSAAPGSCGHVLIVDDNADLVELFAEALRLLGYSVDTAHDGPSALATAAARAPDIALLDLGLPVMDGFELARRFRESPSLSHVRLLAVTGYGQEADRRRSHEAGFDGHLVKPIDLEQVRVILQKLGHSGGL